MALMSNQSNVLVCGPTASAAARMLLLSGYPIALHQAAPPPVLRRKMAYADAWFDKNATLEGVEARRVKTGASTCCPACICVLVTYVCKLAFLRVRQAKTVEAELDVASACRLCGQAAGFKGGASPDRTSPALRRGVQNAKGDRGGEARCALFVGVGLD